MILGSVEHGPLIWPTIEENRVTRIKKYVELSATEKIQGDCDLKATNIILQGLPSNVYSLVNHHRVAKDPWEKSSTSNARQCLKPKRKRDATWLNDKVLLVEAQGNGKVLNDEELELLADPGIAEGPVTQSVITHNTTYQADDLDAYDSDYDEISTAKVVLMANLSSYGSDVLSKETIVGSGLKLRVQATIISKLFKRDIAKVQCQRSISKVSNIQAVQDTNSSAQQDAIILFVFEQLSNQVTNCNKVNEDNLISNESLFVELERYKERVKFLEERQNVDLEKEAKNIDNEIALEKKVKELDNIVHKMGQSAQTVHMLTKPQFFYDNNLKPTLGFQNPFYLKKSQQIRPMLDDGSVIAKETNVISIVDSEETLMLEVTKLIAENEHLKQTYKQLYDSIKPSRICAKEHAESLVNQLNQKSVEITDLNAQLQEKVFVITTLKNDLRKFKGKDIVDNAAQVSNTTTIAVGMYKLDPVTLAPKDENNKETHIYYLIHTIEQAAILREIVEQARSLNPLDSAFYSACKYVKLIQELLEYFRDTCPNIHKPRVSRYTKSSRLKSTNSIKNDRILQISSSTKKKNKVEDHYRIVKSSFNKTNCVVEHSGNANVQNSKLNTNSKLVCVKCNSSMFDARHELCFLEFVSDMNASSKSKSVKKTKKKEEWKLTRKVFTKIGYQ
ncbi:hypothetical protein Tco_1031492 [Tanacetum coccineum]|uniref:Uncharacterized protein n=1 Tax=Tanacetum coccineum TaxID=301880 RepID=A0ABQ5GAI3_9ASTR